MSLDQAGSAANMTGDSLLRRLSPTSQLFLALLIGIFPTVALTVRLCEGENPARVVIDPSGRLPDDSPVLREDGVRRILIQAVESKRGPGVEVITLPAPGGRIDPAAIVDALQEAGLTNLLIEGGSFTITKFMQAELLDRLHIAVSPILIGDGPMGLTLHQEPKNLKDSLS